MMEQIFKQNWSGKKITVYAFFKKRKTNERSCQIYIYMTSICSQSQRCSIQLHYNVLIKY